MGYFDNEDDRKAEVERQLQQWRVDDLDDQRRRFKENRKAAGGDDGPVANFVESVKQLIGGVLAFILLGALAISVLGGLLNASSCSSDYGEREYRAL